MALCFGDWRTWSHAEYIIISQPILLPHYHQHPQLNAGGWETLMSKHPFMLLQLFPLSPQQDDGDELLITAKELQFPTLCALGSEYWDVLALLLRVPESCNCSWWNCQAQLYKNIIKLLMETPALSLPVVSHITSISLMLSIKTLSLHTHLIQCQISSAISRAIN